MEQLTLPRLGGDLNRLGGDLNRLWEGVLEKLWHLPLLECNLAYS